MSALYFILASLYMLALLSVWWIVVRDYRKGYVVNMWNVTSISLLLSLGLIPFVNLIITGMIVIGIITAGMTGDLPEWQLQRKTKKD